MTDRKLSWRLLSALTLAASWSTTAAQPGQMLWEYKTGSVPSSPAIGGNGNVYVVTSHEVHALKPSGALQWTFVTSDGLAIERGFTPVVGPDGTAYVQALRQGEPGYHRVHALDGATGQKRWESGMLVGTPRSSALALGADGTVYVGWEAHRKIPGSYSDYEYRMGIFALDGASGHSLWDHRIAGPTPFSGGPDVSPAVGLDGTVYLGWEEVGHAALAAFNGASGHKRWEAQLSFYASRSPAIGADGTVYVGCGDGRLYALDGATGQKRWEFLAGAAIYSAPAIGVDGTVYVAASSPDNGLYALDGATGQKRWETRLWDIVSGSAAIGADGTVYVCSQDMVCYALDEATGQTRWEWRPPDANAGAGIYTSPTITTDGIVIITSSYPDSRVYALASSSVGGLASSSWPKFRGNAQNTGRWRGAVPAFEGQPSRVVLKEGGEDRIAVQVSGDPVPQCQWFFDRAAVPEGTNAALILPAVTRALEGLYWLVASNALGQATSAPIVAVVSNVDPELFPAFRWQTSAGPVDAQQAATVTGPWTTVGPPSAGATSGWFVETNAVEASRFYRLVGEGAPRFTGASLIPGWWYGEAAGSRHRIEYVQSQSDGTNWVVLTELTLPASPHLFLDTEATDHPGRVYRTTPMP